MRFASLIGAAGTRTSRRGGYGPVLTALVLAAALAGCAGSSGAERPIGERYEGPAVRVTFGRSRSEASSPDGAVRIFAAFDPVLLRGTWAPGGELSSAEWSPLDLHPIQAMRVCFSHTGPCRPEGQWRPYELVLERTVSESAVVQGQLWLGAAFRDADGSPVLAFVDPSAPRAVISTSLTLSGGD